MMVAINDSKAKSKNVSPSSINTKATFLLVLLAFACCWGYVDGGRMKQKNSVNAVSDMTVMDDDIPEVHFLVEMIGKEIYAMVKKPKYKFYIYMTIGTLPNEQNTIVLLSTVCNLLYGICVLCGFLLLPRGPMLFATLATLWIGPALVLILLGTTAAALAAFALYPIASVTFMCTWFFVTSRMAQTLGKRWGLDSDNDGDVDWLDVLHVLATTDIGQSLGMMKLHEILNKANQDPFQEIHHKLNDIDRSTKQLTEKRKVT
jgi:hypothetical protein